MPHPSAHPGRSSQSAPRAAITGLGLVSPLGRSLWSTTRALLDARTTSDILDRAQREIDEDQTPNPHPALALTQDPSLITQTVGAVGRVAPWIEDPAIELADLAAREALAGSAMSTTENSPQGVRTIIASSKGAILSLIDDRFARARDDAAALGPHEWLAHRLRIRLNLGHTTSVVAACATSACAIHQARHEIESGEHDRVLVIAVEAALHPIFAHSYKRLGVLAPINPLLAHRPRPLDNNRAGFTLVEIASAILLEREPDARAQGKRIHATILGSATGTEPFDIVRSAPVFRSLTSCINRAVPPGATLSLIQPHATGTRDNDPRELSAILEALPQSNNSPIYASKGALGHPLGASALVNLTLGCAFAQARQRPPMPWLTDPIDSSMSLHQSAQPITPGAQLITSAGFGGHVAAICFNTAPANRSG